MPKMHIPNSDKHVVYYNLDVIISVGYSVKSIRGTQIRQWVTKYQTMHLYGKARRTISEHIRNIYAEGELERDSTWREFRQVQKEGGRKVERNVSLYN